MYKALTSNNRQTEPIKLNNDVFRDIRAALFVWKLLTVASVYGEKRAKQDVLAVVGST